MTLRLLPAAFAALLLAACSGNPPMQTRAPSAKITTAREIDAIAALLYQGERKEAKRRVNAALKSDPMNPSLVLLEQAISGDAREDLGPSNYPYVVQPGDTMAKLANKFLGNTLKAYQLAQYNGIDVPNYLKSGTVLRIPGQRPPPPSALRVTPAPAAAPAPSRPGSSPPRLATNADPAAAKRAQAAGLEALNEGRVNEAVTQLRRAAALDPSNSAIGFDLARAERISATVRSRQ